jgi:hypothetical protein
MKELKDDLGTLAKILGKNGESLTLNTLQFAFSRAGSGAKWGPYYEEQASF